MPHNCIFLIDTYNSIEGTKHAIEAAKQMQKHGKKMLGVRLDSGDLVHLSIQVRKLLDHAGFKDAKIMASNELDERLIADLKQQGSKVTIWGVGTHLVTAKDQPALDGVYKLSAIQDSNGKWEYKIKISDQFAKATNPGILQVRRYEDFDLLYDAYIEPAPTTGVDLADPMTTLKAKGVHKDLLIPVMRQGKRCYTSPTLEQIRAKARVELDRLHPATRRFLNPEPYVVGLEKQLYALKQKLGRRG
jgi:nicotinate phosphoribosyltransferase